jgi:tetrahydromethanopterin S-methyltransferase subunit E
MIFMMQFSIITITTFVTLLNNIVIYIAKTTFQFDIKKYIPIISIIFGMLLGIIGFYTPDVDMGTNLIEAVFIGISAGASATGIDQVGKQLNKND